MGKFPVRLAIGLLTLSSAYACGTATTHIASSASATRVAVSSPAPDANPSPGPTTPTGPIELNYVEQISPVSYPASAVSRAITVSHSRANPIDRGRVTAASSTRLSPPAPPGVVTSYDIDPLRTTPRGLTAGPGNSVWFSANNWLQVGTLTAGGDVTTYTLPDVVGSGGMITLGPDKNMWFGFCNQDQCYVGRLTASGTFSQFAVHGRPLSLSPGPGGAVWLTEYQESRIVRLGLDGSEEDFQLPSGEWPAEIVSGPDGAVWFNTTTGIGRLTPDGSYSRLSLNGASNGLLFAPDGTLWVTVRLGHSNGELQRWTAGGQLVDSVQLDLEPLRITSGDDGAIWFTAGAWTSPSSFDGRLGEIKDGAIGIYVLPGANYANGLAVIDGSVWFSDQAVSRYTP